MINEFLDIYEAGLRDSRASLTMTEAIHRIVEKTNLLIRHFNLLEDNVNESIKDFTEKIEYYLNNGMIDEVSKKFDELVENGTIESIINDKLFNEIKSDIEILKSANTNHEANLNTLNSWKQETEVDLEGIHDTIDSHTNEFNLLREGMATLVKSEAELEEAVNSGRRIIVIKSGEYDYSKSYWLRSNTKIVGNGEVIFKFKAGGQNILFSNYLTGNESGYEGTTNIRIENITCDLSNRDDRVTTFGFAHANNIILDNIRLKGGNAWHYVEFNGCADCEIMNCRLSDYGTNNPNGTASEMIQLDGSLNSSCYPWTCKYDKTMCRNIKIHNNRFYNCHSSCIGNHTFEAGCITQSIEIYENDIQRCFKFMTLSDIIGLYVHDNYGIDVCHFYYGGKQQNMCKTFMFYSNDITGTKGKDYLNDNVGRFFWGTNTDLSFALVKIYDNRICNFSGHSIGLTGNWVDINNNFIQTSGKHGIYAYGGAKWKIRNNVVVDAAQSSIRLGENPNLELWGATVTDNDFDNIGSVSGINQNTVVTNNRGTIESELVAQVKSGNVTGNFSY